MSGQISRLRRKSRLPRQIRRERLQAAHHHVLRHVHVQERPVHKQNWRVRRQ
ncbi:hypothetical protein DPMN_170925 [Dreissena polymorpha]|uniref:Uncharacterized protein n=1 Tax=Dreissena polymorpha TaxID=45954 RepID=A0A9D4DXZ0_DREPO|nr:hypothetical protein DPMN_170925 [Dreissena polymorpha]